jgi:protoporphyrinogen/coproporphyrinogen III oxidase
MSRIVVIGGGIAGLAAAYELRDHDVTVVDGATRLGGKLATTEVGGLEVDAGAEAFLARVPEALDLATAVGLGDELVNPATSSASVWARGRLRPLPARTVFGVPSSVRSLSGVLSGAEQARVALDLVLPGGETTDDVSVGQLVGRRLGRAVVERLVDPLLGGVYAGRADLLSARAAVPPLAAVSGSLVRAARDSMPAGPPAPVFATVRSGLGVFAQRVADASGAVAVTGRPVRRLERTAAGFRVIHGATVDEQAIAADAVVVAVPAAPAARLLTDVAPLAAAELAVIEAASLAIVTTVWRRADAPESAATTGTSGYLVPAVAGRVVKAVTFSSQKWDHIGTGELVAVRASIGRYGDESALQRDDDELVDLAVAELTGIAGFRGQPVATGVHRWGGGLPQYAVGHVDRVRRIRAAVAEVPGLAVCGAVYDGVGVPACIRTGVAAAAQVREALRP